MRANAWRKYLEEQRQRHGKVLFTRTELANVAGVSLAALNVELARLRRQEIIVRYAHGLYGMPGAISPQLLVPAIDPHAYITGHYALYDYQMVTQMPVAITCFTDRRSPRAQQRMTPVGRLSFVCIRSSVYSPVPEAAMAPPPQALCDYVYLSRRHGVEPEALVAFRNLKRIRAEELAPILPRYPISVQKHVERLLHARAPGIRSAALAVLLFAVVGSQQAAVRPVALTYAEAAAWMRAERGGNRTANVEQSGTAAGFAAPFARSEP